MATTAVGIGDFTGAFRQAILPYIQDNVPEQAKLLKVLKKNDNVRVFNNTFYAPIRSTRHGGVTNLASDKNKVVTGSSAVTQASVTPKYLTGTFDISDVVDKASKNDPGAVQAAMEFQTKTLTADFSKNANRQYWSDGAGVIAMVPESSGSLSGTTFQVQYPNQDMNTEGRAANYYGTTSGGINGDIKPTKYFAAGQIIGLGSAGTSVGTILSVAGGTALGTITLSGASSGGIPGSAPVYILDGDASAAGTTEIQGIRAALSEGTGNYATLARSIDVWSPQFMGTAQNQALTINNMEAMFMTAYEYAQPGDRYAWFCNKSLFTKFGDLLTAMRRTNDKIELVSGWSGLSFEIGAGNVPVMWDYDVPDGEMILLNLDTWTVCQIADMGFVGPDLLRRTDFITFQKVFSWYTNLLCLAPAANGRMVRQTK